MFGWKKNLKGFTKGLGEWLSWSYQKDNTNDFFNPLICISSSKMGFICEEMTILVKGKNYEIKSIEVTK